MLNNGNNKEELGIREGKERVEMGIKTPKYANSGPVSSSRGKVDYDGEECLTSVQHSVRN